ncbi:MAG: DUF177 domain-containing protein [Christensenella sp.]|uniref:YceD family protein n=1 Tax=Christensenella sp. TaxID=1935934 RepID=UPI002B21D81C|nr:DUF177 domain-containing protein [Christensenella sp.]MEA5003708.1 DUF177 domain-containing protein [Christensenella sp.]
MIDINLSTALKSEGETYSYEYSGTPDFGKDIDLNESLKLHADYSADEKRISIKGTIHTVLNVRCDRCLKEMTYDFAGKFDEVFLPEGTQGEDEYTYRSETLCLDKMVYDIIMLGLPHQLLCDEKCKGLCPKCGQDLNITQCECETNDTDETNPFAKLKGLF